MRSHVMSKVSQLLSQLPPAPPTQRKRLLTLRLPSYGLMLGLLASAHAASIITFAVPGAVQGTFGLSINTAGAITGYYLDTGGVYHGFLRGPNGTITTFDAPGAGTASGLGTSGLSINTAGAITGYYWDAGNVSHGFVRAPNGTISTFDAPGAGGGSATGTISRSINTAGAITGSYQDASYVNHGFVRAPNGTISTSDAPAGTSSGQIVAFSINDEGAITGYYWSNVGTFDAHAFVRAPDGTITTFDGPGVGTINTTGLSINTAGAITGNYQNASGGLDGFLRAPNGSITTFDAPDGQTTPFDINTAGAITGTTGSQGFLRAPNGTITTLPFISRSINTVGAITGYAGGQGFLYTSCQYVSYQVQPTTVKLGGTVTVSGEIQSCSTVEQKLRLELTLTGPCSKSLVGSIPLIVPPGLNLPFSFPLPISPHGCTGSYTLSDTIMSGATLIEQNSAELTVTSN
jgi:hypothetical protein